MFEHMTWTCHVCGDTRPDPKISVWTTRVRLDSDLVMQQNVRYCNDRPDCIEKAPDISFIPNKENKVPDSQDRLPLEMDFSIGSLDQKYVVFKRDEFEACGFVHPPPVVEDAVVIRRQDHFAPAALSVYASSIAMVAQTLREIGATNGLGKRLQSIADYFSTQADLARDEAHKLPD